MALVAIGVVVVLLATGGGDDDDDEQATATAGVVDTVSTEPIDDTAPPAPTPATVVAPTTNSPTTDSPITSPSITDPDFSLPPFPEDPSLTLAPRGEIPPSTEPPEDLGDDPAFDALAADCYDGSMSACDQLYLQSPSESEYERYADTCAGRQPEDTGVYCRSAFPE